MQQSITRRLVDIYYSSRPNLDLTHKPFSVFFFACSGAGKSTIRRHLVNELGATYVCNDEVRELLEKYPEAGQANVEIKHIVAETVRKIIAEANNKLIIFGNLPEQLRAYDLAAKDIVPNFVLADSYDENQIKALTARLKQAVAES